MKKENLNQYLLSKENFSKKTETEKEVLLSNLINFSADIVNKIEELISSSLYSSSFLLKIDKNIKNKIIDIYADNVDFSEFSETKKNEFLECYKDIGLNHPKIVSNFLDNFNSINADMRTESEIKMMENFVERDYQKKLLKTHKDLISKLDFILVNSNKNKKII